MRKKGLALLFITVILLVQCLPAFAFTNSYSAYEYFYSQLSSDEKAVYNGVKNAVAAETSTFSLSGLTTVQKDFTFTQSGITTQQQLSNAVSGRPELQNANDTIGKVFQSAMDAFWLDHPEYFWIDTGVSVETAVNSVGDRITVRFTYFGTVSVKSGYFGYKSQYSSIIAEIRSIGATGSRYDMLLRIHDYLCQNIVYDLNASRRENAAGAYLDGRAVCQGYAHAFKMACDYYGIPCICITGTATSDEGSEGHMWNAVQMQDGKWYAVDVTWDDQSKIYYDFFLVGSSTVDESFGQVAFSVGHRENGYQTDSSTKRLSYPSLSSSAYQNDTAVPEPTPTSSVKVTPTATPGKSDPTASPKPSRTPEPKAGESTPIPDESSEESEESAEEIVSEQSGAEASENSEKPKGEMTETDESKAEEPVKDSLFTPFVIGVIAAGVVVGISGILWMLAVLRKRKKNL